MWDRLSLMNMGLLYEYEYKKASVVHVYWTINAMQYWTIPYVCGKVPYTYERPLSYTYAYVGPLTLPFVARTGHLSFDKWVAYNKAHKTEKVHDLVVYT